MGPIAQSVERRTLNPWVNGSIPAMPVHFYPSKFGHSLFLLIQANETCLAAVTFFVSVPLKDVIFTGLFVAAASLATVFGFSIQELFNREQSLDSPPFNYFFTRSSY